MGADIFLCIVCAFFTLHCGQNHSITIRIDKIDIKKIALDSLTDCEPRATFYYDDAAHNKEYLVNLVSRQRILQFYDMSAAQVAYIVPLSKEIRTSGFCIINMDSILVIQNDFDKNYMQLINKNGVVLKTWDLTQMILPHCDSLVRYMAYSAPFSPMFISKTGDVYIHINSLLPYELRDKYYYTATECRLNIYKESDKLNLLAYFPETYLKGKNYNAGFMSSALNDKNQLVCSFQADHNLYVYDKDGTIISTHFTKSQFLDSNFPVFDTTIHDPEYDKKFTIESGFYNQIIYDPYRNLYYRIASHRQNLINPDSTVNDYGTNPWSIIILDSAFNIIQEISMPPKYFDYNSTAVAKDGLLIFHDCVQSPDNDRNHITFTEFYLSKTEK